MASENVSGATPLYICPEVNYKIEASESCLGAHPAMCQAVNGVLSLVMVGLKASESLLGAHPAVCQVMIRLVQCCARGRVFACNSTSANLMFLRKQINDLQEGWFVPLERVPCCSHTVGRL